MSAAVDVLRRLLASEPGAGEALLPACRAQAFGAEAFGGGAIAELFAERPLALSPDPHVIETPRSLALFDADEEGREHAVIADLFDTRIGRLWRLSPASQDAAPSPAAEPRVDVAFDPYLSQAREWPAPSPVEQPECEAAAWPALEKIAAEAALDQGPRRARVLILRAFAADGRGGALLAAQGETGAQQRRIQTTLMAATFRYGADGALLHGRLVTDGAPPSEPLRRLAGQLRE